MSNIIDSIKLSGTVYTLSAQTSGGGNPTVELTQAEYDALVTAGTVSADTYYIITDAQAGDLTNYYTKTETNTLLGGKADTATTYTKTEVDNAITAATSTKQDTLVSGTNIKTINNTSILGSGNIDIQGGGGGKAIEAGRGISITTGETADTVSFNLPVYGDSNENVFCIQSGHTIQQKASQNFICGFGNSVKGKSSSGKVLYNAVFGINNNIQNTRNYTENSCSAVFGRANEIINANEAFVAGYENKANSNYESAFGFYNASNTGSTEADRTLFSVGNGTADNARHNAFEIRQNGDIYLSSGGTDIKLQDHLGGGGSVTVDTELDSGSTNPVENRVIYNKIDEVEQVTAAALNELNDAVSGKQDTLVSGTNIKTINNTSILGSGNIDIQGGGGTVESAITSGSTNAVESKAIWSATTFNKGVLLTFNGYGYRRSTNYPEGCGKLVVENIGSYDYSDITFRNDGGSRPGRIRIENFGNISVDTSQFEGATATVDGNKVTIIYPSTGITYVEVINTSWTYTAVVEGAWVNENTYMKFEVDAIANGLQNNINSKLDATAYTPTVVDSALYAGSQNPVKNQALYSELRIDNGETETTLAFENRYSTNYPNGCTKLNVEVVGSNNNSNINFYNDNQRLGYITIDNWGGISVNVHFDGASYEISGTTVIITYPTVTNVTKIEVDGSGNHVYKAIVANATPLIDQVAANTTALGAVESRIAEDEEVTAAALNELNDNFGGLKLVKLSQAEYNALATKDSSTLYVIVD